MNSEVFSGVLNDLIDRDVTTVKEMAYVSGLCNQTIRNYAACQTEPGFTVLMAWVCHHPSDEVKQAILSAMSRGKAVMAPDLDERELDVDGNGSINIRDAEKTLLDCFDSLRSKFEILFDAHARGGVPTLDQSNLMFSLIIQARHCLRMFEQIWRQYVQPRQKANGGTP